MKIAKSQIAKRLSTHIKMHVNMNKTSVYRTLAKYTRNVSITSDIYAFIYTNKYTHTHIHIVWVVASSRHAQRKIDRPESRYRNRLSKYPAWPEEMIRQTRDRSSRANAFCDIDWKRFEFTYITKHIPYWYMCIKYIRLTHFIVAISVLRGFFLRIYTARDKRENKRTSVYMILWIWQSENEIYIVKIEIKGMSIKRLMCSEKKKEKNDVRVRDDRTGGCYPKCLSRRNRNNDPIVHKAPSI